MHVVLLREFGPPENLRYEEVPDLIPPMIKRGSLRAATMQSP